MPLDTTALPPLPAALTGTTSAPRPRPLDHPLLSIVAFVIMIGAATAPVLRYLGVFDPLPAVHAQATVARDPTPPQPALEPSKAPAKKTQQELRAAQLAELDRTLPKDPKAAAAQLTKAAEARRVAGDLALAELMLARALEHDEENAELAFTFARVRFSQGNLEGAEGWVLKAIHLEPRSAAYHQLYAELLTSLGKTREAARVRREAAALAP